MAFVNVQLRVELLAYDHLRIYFDQPVVITAEINDLDSYTITAITSGVNPIEVVQVMEYDPENELITYLDLKISRATIDAVYQIEIIGFKSSDNDTYITNNNNGMIAKFYGRKTKTDTWASSMARFYDTTLESTLRGVIAAMALEDERIGGRGDLSPIPLIETVKSTYGSATYGTSTYGG